MQPDRPLTNHERALICYAKGEQMLAKANAAFLPASRIIYRRLAVFYFELADQFTGMMTR